MKCKSSLAFVLGVLLPVAGFSPVSAVSIGFDPSSSTVVLGDSVSVDVVISGLGSGVAPSLGDFDLTALFDSSILTSTGVVFGPFLGDPLLFEAFTSSAVAPGSIDFSEFSLLLAFELDALQSDTFPLATLLFDVEGVGDTDLTLGPGPGGIAASDAFGVELPIDAFGSASVSSVPEPSSLLLWGTGMGVLALAVRRRRVKGVRKLNG